MTSDSLDVIGRSPWGLRGGRGTLDERLHLVRLVAELGAHLVRAVGDGVPRLAGLACNLAARSPGIPRDGMSGGSRLVLDPLAGAARLVGDRVADLARLIRYRAADVPGIAGDHMPYMSRVLFHRRVVRLRGRREQCAK